MCSKSCECEPVAGKIYVEPDNLGETKVCRRCGRDPFVLLDKVHVECKECFIESCNKKIRSTIGKSHTIRNGDPVLIAFSGGPSSCALLELVKTSISSSARREQKFRPSILHIDMQSVLSDNISPESRASQLAITLNHLSSAYPDMPIYWSAIELSFSLDSNSQLYSTYECSNPGLAASNILNNSEALSRFKYATSSFDLTDKLKFVSDKCDHYIQTLALQINSQMSNHQHNFKFVLTANSATQLANKLLVDVILGQGSGIGSAVSTCDRKAPVPTLRPMREFSAKEIALYLRLKGIEPNVIFDMSTFAQRKSSIQTATEAFLSKLYVDYPSTYNTLLRTGSKMLN